MTESYIVDVRKVVITGPESSGKTTLAQDLAAHYATTWVHETARDYLQGATRPYEEKDLLAIAELQLRLEDHKASTITSGTPRLLFCDTDLITIRIWGEEKYGRSDPWIVRHTEQRSYDLWLLCKPDMPWEPDPLRENPHDRDRLFSVYESTLLRLAKPHAIMEGGHARRLHKAIALVDALIAPAPVK